MGNPVEFRSGPATVSGDDGSIKPLAARLGRRCRRENHKPGYLF